jgi:hypothetical protein
VSANRLPRQPPRGIVVGDNKRITVSDTSGGGMWAHEQSIETSARPEQIWRL